MRIVTTPLASQVTVPVPRPLGGITPEIGRAVVGGDRVDGQLRRLRNPETLVVTTGQQPGLFAGPLYTVYKALSAAALARELERRWTRPVVPVFWLANDDHDFAEARSAHWLGADGDVVTAQLAERPADAPLTPMYKLRLGPEVEDLLAQFRDSHPDTPARGEAVEWLTRHYVAGGTVGGAYGGALAELLAPFGVVCLDSTDAAVKAAAAPLILRALELAGPLDAALSAHARELEAQGTRLRVTVGDGATLGFIEHAEGRDRLVADNGRFHARRSGASFTLDDLAEAARATPERLSPNVLLRPVIESAILPTVAYVAGPGELAYLPMCAPIYTALEVPLQRYVPRWSGIVVEPRVDRVLAKFDANLDELLAADHALEARVVRAQVPVTVAEAAQRLRAAIEREYGLLGPEAVAIDPTLTRPVENARHHALTGLGDLEKKIQQHLRKREATELAQIARARTAVLPGGKSQERVLTAAGVIARHGASFLDTVNETVAQWYRTALAGGGSPS